MGAPVAAQTSPPATVHSQTLEMFHPTVWGDFFLTNNLSQSQQSILSGWNVQVTELKQDVEKMLTAATDNKPSQKLSFIDAVQRLGIGYLFEAEIDRQLQLIYHNRTEGDDGDHLSTVSLQFRLMRQHRYHVPSDVFNKFKDVDGTFKSELSSDMEGILSLYEAAYLGVPGETILDEAIEFTKTCLVNYKAADHDHDHELDSSGTLAERVTHALKRPLRKGVEKHEQLFFISMYEQDRRHDPTLLKLAKLCFNVVQDLYQKELRALTKWWVELDLAAKLPFARDRLVEVYFWALAAMWEPKYSLARHFLTKATMFVSSLDDIYDVKATIDELELFTDTICRWETNKGKDDDDDDDDLPEYMRHWMEGMTWVVDGIDEIASKEGRSYCVEYVKQAVKNQAQAYLSEARWLAQGVVPSVEEYRRVGVYSCCYPLVAVAALCGMGDKASKEVFEWLFTDPTILVASSDICRLMDDVVSHEFEQQRRHVASSVECYMKQYGAGKTEARNAINKMVEEDWKVINDELLIAKPPQKMIIFNSKFRPDKEVMSIFLGLARVMDVLYKDSDGYTHSAADTKDILTALLVTPMII